MEEEKSLDSVLKQIGEFGPYQLINYILLCMPMIFNSFQSISYVFTASSVVHRCNVTECDTLSSGYWEPWIHFTIPSKEGGYKDPCHQYNFIKSSDIKTNTCAKDRFNKSQVVECRDGYKFRDKEITISNEFGLLCNNEWQLNMVGTLNNVGQFIGIPLGGFLADRYGRRTMLAICGFISSIMGIIRSFSINYYMFVSLEVLDMIAGSTLYPTAFLLAIELVGPKCRVGAATIITVFYALGEVLLALFARTFQNWRHFLRVLYIPALLHIFLLFVLPESVRWLLSQGKDNKAARILRRASRINCKPLDESTLQQLIEANNRKLEEANEGKYPLRLTLKTFWWRLMNCSFCWFTHTLVALGLSLTSVKLAGDKYMNFMWNGLIQVPGLIVPLIVGDLVGRRISLFVSLLSCGLCMLTTIFLAKYGHAIELTLFLMGKLAITCSFQLLYFFTFELFPTNVRNSSLSLCSMIGRIGSMLAPQIPLLMQRYQYAPQLIFSVFALLSACLTLLFPETAKKSLPTTIEEASQRKKVTEETNL